MPASKRINSLAFRQAKTVFLVSVILGIIFSLYQILVDLHQEHKRIEEHYQFKLLQNYSNASQAAYHLNQLLAEQVASSLLMDSAIYQVAIVDDFGDVLTEQERNISMESSFTEALSHYLTPNTPVYQTELHQPNSHVVVGMLSFSVNGANIAKNFIAKTSQILLFDLFRNILLTTILLLFFYQKLSKPLVTLIEWVRSLQNKETEVSMPNLHRDDELGQLATTFHTLWKDREAAEAKLNQLAYYDSLTGLANRSLLLQTLDDIIKKAQQDNTAGVLFYLDLEIQDYQRFVGTYHW